MAQPILRKSDVKFIIDNRGEKRMVLLNYEKFQHLMEILEGQIYFESPNVQERLRRSEEDIKKGRYLKVKAEEINKGLEWLHG